MEIELKKIKLTNSIIGQLNMAMPSQIINFEVLGYVNHKKDKKVLLYDKMTNRLAYCFYIQEIRFNEDSVQIDSHGAHEQQYWVSLFLGHNRYIKLYGEDRTNKTAVESLLKEMQEKFANVNQIFY